MYICNYDSELQKMEVKGEMKLTVSNPDDSRAIVHLTPPRSDIKFKTPSKVNLDAWNSQHCISLGILILNIQHS